MIVVLMGPSGSGKSTVGRALAGALGWQLIEADDLHPARNREKLARGEPLDDADRAPWLHAVASRIALELAADKDAVIACSALRESYRRILRADPFRVKLVELAVPPAVLAERLAARTGHFASPALLPSQLATHEATTDARVVEADAPVDEVVIRIRKALGL